MPQTASKESKGDIKRGGGEGVEMLQGGKKKSTQRIYVNAEPACQAGSLEEGSEDPGSVNSTITALLIYAALQTTQGTPR